MQAQIPQPTDFDGWKNRGMVLLRAGQFQEAADAFERATNLKPSDAGARLNLGSAYMVMSFGAQTPGDVADAIRAKTEFKRVLALDPENAMAFAALAAMSYQEAKPLQGNEKLSKLHEARDWNKRVISADRTNKQAYLSLGVIAWTEFYPAWTEARATDGLKPGEAGPLRAAASRTKLLSQYGSLIEDGIANLRDAINIDPQYDRAMGYMSLLVSERADLRDTHDEYTRDMTEATGWFHRALDALRGKSQRPQPVTAGLNGAWFEALLLVLAVPPPPPPPPPPPLPPGVRLPSGIRAPVPPTIGKIEITGVSPEVAQMVLDRLRVRAGDPTSPETIDLVTAEVRQIDEHFRVGVTLGADDPPSSTGATLHIAIKSIALPLGPDPVTFEPLPDPTGKRIMLEPEVAAANLITKINPTYPVLAKTARIQGVVQLMTTLGTDGRILNLQVLSGHPALVPAALKAVKQWVFKPTLRDGKPVEVTTRVTVNFALPDQ
jgi:protein TonB